MNDRTTYKVEAKYDFVYGTLEFNIPDIIAELNEEDRKSLAQLHTFESAMWEEIKREVESGHSSDSYNSNIHKLRIELLAGEGVDEILKRTVRGILMDLESAKQRARHYRDNYFQMRRWCTDNLTWSQRDMMPKEIKWESFPSIRNADVEEAIAKAQGED